MSRLMLMLVCGLGLLPLPAAAQKPSHSAPVRDAILRGSESVPPSRVSLTERLACSSLCQARQSLDLALRAIADGGYRWVDLSCLEWAPHVNVASLVQNFDEEAARVGIAVTNCGLRVANLTFDSADARPYEEYRPQFEAVVKLARRLKARLVNIMAASPKSERAEYVARLRELQSIALKAGVLLTLETHCNQVTERPGDAVMLCRQVPGLGLTLDPSHYYAGPHQGRGFDELLPFVQSTGFRAGGTSLETIQLPWGEGPIDFGALVRNLEAAGYKGFYVCEYIEGFNQCDALAQSRRFLQWAAKL